MGHKNVNNYLCVQMAVGYVSGQLGFGCLYAISTSHTHCLLSLAAMKVTTQWLKPPICLCSVIIARVRHVLSENVWNLEAMRLLLRHIWAKTMPFRRQMTEYHVHDYLPFPTALCSVQHWFPPANRLLISQATPFSGKVCETNRLHEMQENLEEMLLHCSQPSHKFQCVTSRHVLCEGFCQTMAFKHVSLDF